MSRNECGTGREGKWELESKHGLGEKLVAQGILGSCGSV